MEGHGFFSLARRRLEVPEPEGVSPSTAARKGAGERFDVVPGGSGQAIPVLLSACAGMGFESAVDLPLTDEEDEPEEEEAVKLREDDFVLLGHALKKARRHDRIGVVLCRPKAAERPPLRCLPKRAWTSMPPATSASRHANSCRD